MTIDEAIEHEKMLVMMHAQFTDSVIQKELKEEAQQRAEWLEELKTTKIALEKANGCLEANWKLGYQKAIEDFVDYAGDILSTSDRDFYCSGVIDEIAEQLKAGGTDA